MITADALFVFSFISIEQFCVCVDWGLRFYKMPFLHSTVCNTPPPPSPTFVTQVSFCHCWYDIFETIFLILQVNLEALYNFMGVMIGSSVIPIILCMFWTRLTGKAMELAAILGLFLGISAWLLSSVVLHREFNLSKFLENTSGKFTVYI